MTKCVRTLQSKKQLHNIVKEVKLLYFISHRLLAMTLEDKFSDKEQFYWKYGRILCYMTEAWSMIDCRRKFSVKITKQSPHASLETCSLKALALWKHLLSTVKGVTIKWAESSYEPVSNEEWCCDLQIFPDQREFSRERQKKDQVLQVSKQSFNE